MDQIQKYFVFFISTIFWCLLLLFAVNSKDFHRGNIQNHSSITVGQNFRIYPSNISQSETFITRHPSDPLILFASANTINLISGFISEGIYVSTDGGNNWFGSDTCSGSPIAFHRGDPGIAIDKDGTFILIRLGFSPGLYSHFSTDNGLSWSGQLTIATDDQDRASLISDPVPSGGFYGRTYAAWVKYAPPFPIYFSFTDNGGSNWSSPSQINNPPQRCQGGELAIGPNGEVYSCWAGVINTSPFTEDFVGFASSSDGGASWTVTENAFDINGIAGILAQKANIRVNGLPRIDVDRSGGTRDGWIYIVTTQKNLAPAGNDPDIVLYRSANGGSSWSSGIRVNQDPQNNGKIQYFPAIHVDNAGGVNIVYYDDRHTTSDSSGIILARSTDGGDSWDEVSISDHNFKPEPIGGLGQGYQGDNIGLTSVQNTLFPVWMDNSSGIYQIWSCPVDIPPSVLRESDQYFTNFFRLNQNYPNPFNSSTIISYHLNEKTHVQIKIFNIKGQEIDILVDTIKNAGTHKIQFSTSEELSSGIYLYQLSTPAYSIVNRMLLIK